VIQAEENHPPVDAGRQPSQITIKFRVTDEFDDPPVFATDSRTITYSTRENDLSFAGQVRGGYDPDGLDIIPVFYHIVG
jgi:hypothetical protein